MKAIKHLSFLLIGIIGIQTTFAFVGVRAGLNLGKVEIGGDNSANYSSAYSQGSSSETSDESLMQGNLIGLNIGAVMDINITDFLYVQPGIMLTSKGFNTEKSYESSYSSGMGGNSIENEKETNKLSAYYIDVPIMLSLKGTLADNLALRAHIGPYFGFGLSGEFERSYSYSDSDYPEDNENVKVKVKDAFSPTAEEVEETEFPGLNRFNCGIGFGAGIEFNNFYLGVNYNMGLTNMVKKYNRSEMGTEVEAEMEGYERTVSFTVGYNF